MAWYVASRGSGTGNGNSAAEVIPPGVGGGAVTVQAAAHLDPEHFADIDDAYYALEASADLDSAMRGFITS